MFKGLKQISDEDGIDVSLGKNLIIIDDYMSDIDLEALRFKKRQIIGMIISVILWLGVAALIYFKY